MADLAMLNIALRQKYYVNLVKMIRMANILEDIELLCYNVTNLLKIEGLHKVDKSL